MRQAGVLNDYMFPTRVGMNRENGFLKCCGAYVPHTRGDEPLPESEELEFFKCSPHAWG